MKIKLENNIDIPLYRGCLPLNEMEIGQSFFVPNRTASTIWQLLKNFQRKNPDKKFTCRTINKGVRVWRIE